MLSFELLRRGCDVAIGKIDNREVDFIATKVDVKIHRIEWNLDIFRRWSIIKTGGTTNARKRTFETGRAIRI